MKNKVIASMAAALAIAAGVSAQGVENDDMYFNSSDRAGLKAKRATAQQAAYAKREEKQSVSSPQVYEDLTSDYSARNINPEYAARANAETAIADNEDYFISNYQYTAATNLNNWNNSYASRYNDPWYNTGFYNPYISSWSSPYYGSAYDYYGSPWYNPYYTSGWSGSFSYYYGNSWNYGWGPSYGTSIAYGWGNPYSGWGWSIGVGSTWGSGGYGLYCPSSFNNYYYYAGDYRGEIAYGKRATRGGAIDRQVGSSPADRSRTAYASSTNPVYGRDTGGGRVSSSSVSQQPEAYYNRTWRAQQQSAQYPGRSATRGSWSDNTYQSSQSSGFSNQSNVSRGYDSGTSRSSGSMSTGTRSSAPASSGSNGRTRGRD